MNGPEGLRAFLALPGSAWRTALHRDLGVLHRKMGMPPEEHPSRDPDLWERLAKSPEWNAISSKVLDYSTP